MSASSGIVKSYGPHLNSLKLENGLLKRSLENDDGTITKLQLNNLKKWSDRDIAASAR